MTKAELNREIAQYGFELVRGPEGYFYWAHLETAPTSDAIDRAESVYVNRFDQVSDSEWRDRAQVIIDGINAEKKEA